MDWLEGFCLGVFEDPKEQGGLKLAEGPSGVMLWPTVGDSHMVSQQHRNEKPADQSSLVHTLGCVSFLELMSS